MPLEIKNLKWSVWLFARWDGAIPRDALPLAMAKSHFPALDNFPRLIKL